MFPFVAILAGVDLFLVAFEALHDFLPPVVSIEHHTERGRHTILSKTKDPKSVLLVEIARYSRVLFVRLCRVIPVMVVTSLSTFLALPGRLFANCEVFIVFTAMHGQFPWSSFPVCSAATFVHF